MALKHVVFQLYCLWHGHELTSAKYYSLTYDRFLDCTICKRCRKVL